MSIEAESICVQNGINFGNIFAIPEAALVINIFIALCLIVLAVYGVIKIRDFMAGTMPKSGEYITDFESMKDEGLIDDKELNQVKNVVGMSQELVNDEPVENEKVQVDSND